MVPILLVTENVPPATESIGIISESPSISFVIDSSGSRPPVRTIPESFHYEALNKALGEYAISWNGPY